MNSIRAEELLEKYLAGSCTEEEKALFESIYNKIVADQPIIAYENDLNQIKDLIYARLPKADVHVVPMEVQQLRPWSLGNWYKVAGVAAAVATIVFGVWFFSARHLDSSSLRAQRGNLKDIVPGRSGATIALSTGEVIQLDSTKKGVIVGRELKYSDGGVISSEPSSSQGNARDLLNSGNKGSLSSLEMTASTSKGQTYQFTLPDGTQVYLNADSKISFPAQFSGKERRILLAGEALFEVVHNSKMPFRVESRGINGNSQVVEDIGTIFNINAYPDERGIRTTLVEGSALVRNLASSNPLSSRANARDLLNSRGKRSLGALEMTGTHKVTGANEMTDAGGITLIPNQQASLQNGAIKVKTVNPEEATAWKSGIFMYNHTPLEEVMRQVARWYNVEIAYADPSAKSRKLGGTMSRAQKLSVILKTLESTGAATFKIEGRKVIVK